LSYQTPGISDAVGNAWSLAESGFGWWLMKSKIRRRSRRRASGGPTPYCKGFKASAKLRVSPFSSFFLAIYADNVLYLCCSGKRLANPHKAAISIFCRLCCAHLLILDCRYEQNG